MTPSNLSCVVALSTERNCATGAHSATEDATGTALASRKALSLQELRAQLRAQLARNQNPANDAIPPAQSCGVALPIERNRATGKVGAETTAAFDQEWFDEKAGIYEYDGGLSRAEAERRAYLEITK